MTASATIGDKPTTTTSQIPRNKKRSEHMSNPPGRRQLSCEREIAQIAQYLTDEMPAPLASKFEQHLDACTDCVAFVATYKKTIELAREFLRHGIGKPTSPPHWLHKQSSPRPAQPLLPVRH